MASVGSFLSAFNLFKDYSLISHGHRFQNPAMERPIDLLCCFMASPLSPEPVSQLQCVGKPLCEHVRALPVYRCKMLISPSAERNTNRFRNAGKFMLVRRAHMIEVTVKITLKQSWEFYALQYIFGENFWRETLTEIFDVRYENFLTFKLC